MNIINGINKTKLNGINNKIPNIIFSPTRASSKAQGIIGIPSKIKSNNPETIETHKYFPKNFFFFFYICLKVIFFDLSLKAK